MKKFIAIILVGFAIIFLFGCKKKNYKYATFLVGEWNIDVYQQIEIKPDGTEKIIKDERNMGYWSFSNSELGWVDFNTEYFGTPKGKEQGAMVVNEEGKRLVFPYFFSNYGDILDCDLVYNFIKVNKNKVVFEHFVIDGKYRNVDNWSYLVPQPGSENSIKKLRMELSRK
ncbi:MAG TPA: hypothetical protein VLZ83_17085 [Edaphocola sp.]|nr:hypothetical protein [Edaphocola sp.]